jgi:hypothetical protein
MTKAHMDLASWAKKKYHRNLQQIETGSLWKSFSSHKILKTLNSIFTK